MKSNIILCAIFSFIFLSSSCKKENESLPGIVGKWMNTAVYSDPSKGGNGWETVTRFHQFVTFNPNAQFLFFTDMPGGEGMYNYNVSSKELQLNFKADQFGNTTRSEVRKIESITDNKLITVFISPVDGMIYKAEYSRIH